MAAPSLDTQLQNLRADDAGRDREVAAAVRAHLEQVRAHLAELHRASGSGRMVNEANSDLTDRMIRRLFNLAEERILADGGELERGVSVVAVGGYARREMSIHSDVDILIPSTATSSRPTSPRSPSGCSTGSGTPG